jgi:hypothetical protein
MRVDDSLRDRRRPTADHGAGYSALKVSMASSSCVSAVGFAPVTARA